MRLAAIAIVLLASCASDDPEERKPAIPPDTPNPCGATSWPEGYGGWELVCAEADAGQFLSVWGSSQTDVYLVGGKPSKDGAPGETAIWHWDGTRLSPLVSPGKERAWWVFGTGADHVWVVGENGLGLYRENGGDFVHFDTATTQTIYGVWARSPEEVWFVSGDFVTPNAKGRLHRKTPSGTRIVSEPPFDSFDQRALFKVWGTRDEIFVVGEGGAIFRNASGVWSRLATPDESAVLTASGFGNDETYVVGGRGRGAFWRWNGDAIQDLTPADRPIPGLMGVHAGPDRRLLVSGENGFLGEMIGETLHEDPQYTALALHAVWGHEGGGAWAVGGNLADISSAPRGVILRKPITICPEGGINGSGYHHLDLQGRGAAPKADGSYEIFAMPRGEIHPDLVHGEHYLLGPGAFVDFTIPLCADITDQVVFRLPNNDEAGAEALHQLFVVRGGREILVAEARDDVPGDFGYIPFDRSSLPQEEMDTIAGVDTDPSGSERGWEEIADAPRFETKPRDVLARAGDTLLFRSTNISDQMYGLMVWFPQEGLEYQAFLEVQVPETPGGEDGNPRPPPPVPGPCETSSTGARFIELGRGIDRFVPFPPFEATIESGPQGSLMFVVSVRGRGFVPGNPRSPNDESNPLLWIVLSLNAPASMGGKVVADGFWRRGFGVRVDDLELLGLRPTVPAGAARDGDLLSQRIFAEVKLVEPSGATLCHQVSFTARR